MTPTPEPSDTLEELEHRALALSTAASRDTAAWDSLWGELGSLKVKGAPPLDPDAARQSAEELRFLLLAFQQQPSSPAAKPPGPPTRAGYFIEGQRGTQDALVRPAFAETLAAGSPGPSLPDTFPDLWAVDLMLWQQLLANSCPWRSLAVMWLQSPGRRLVQDLSVLRRLPRKRTFGASDFSLQRLQDVAGPLPSNTPPAPGRESWHELHAAVPGPTLSSWKPANADISAVLQILEGRRGDPVFLRGAALAWLLNQAARQPFYELGELKRDLREDFPLAFVNGFPDPEDVLHHAQLRAAARLEGVCLQHASRLMNTHGTEDATAHRWSVARWLQGCTFRSPFFGGDEEALTARLRALLPSEAPAEPRDVLDPNLFGDESKGLDLEDLALVAGAALHYRPRSEHPQLLPTPLPLVKALRRLASRVLKEGEKKAEELLERSVTPSEPRDTPPVFNALHWEAPHLAPPLVARWLMSHHRIAWLKEASPDARRECLHRFAQKPVRYAWMAFAVYTEGRELDAGTRAEVADSWRQAVQVMAERADSQGALGLMAAGVLDQLSPEEALRAVLLAGKAAPEWRHRTLEALAESAEQQGLSALWGAALEGLLAMCEDARLEAQERLKAALLALRQASATRRPERAAYLQRLADVAPFPPFSQNVALRRELRRLGVSPTPDSPRGTH
jgi:hypothetical protein